GRTSVRPRYLHGLKPRSGEDLAADRGHGGVRTRTGNGQRPVDRKDDPKVGPGDGARWPAGLEIGADLWVHRIAVGVLEVDVEMMAPVRLVPVDVDRDRDADDQLGGKLGKAEDVPRPAEHVQLAVDRLGADGKHEGMDVHGPMVGRAVAQKSG